MNDKRDEAISFMQRSQYDLAIPAFLELAKSGPDDYSIHYMLGQCYKFNGQLSESLESLTKSEQLIKDSTPDDKEQGSAWVENLGRMKMQSAPKVLVSVPED